MKPFPFKTANKIIASFSLAVFLLPFHGTLASGKTKNALRFCVTGDSRGKNAKNGGVNEKVLKRLVLELIKEKPEFVLFTGDLVKGSSSPEKLEGQLLHWRAIFMEPLLDAGIAVYPCRGNHDVLKPSKKDHRAQTSLNIWNNVFKGRFQLPQNGPTGEKNITYKIKKKNLSIFCFDLYAPLHEGRVNLAWFARMEEEAHQNPEHYFLFAHEPAYSVRHRDCLDDHPKLRDEMVDIFTKLGGVAMFFGHDHRYNHSKTQTGDKKTIHQFVVGTAGAPFQSWNYLYWDSKVWGIADAQAFGYLLVELDGSKAKLKMKGWKKKDDSLRILDTFEYTLKMESGK